MNSWSQTENDTLIEIELREEGLYFEVGPTSWPARGHEGAGGTLKFEEFLNKPKWFEEFPGLWKRIHKDLQGMGKVE
ncbi:MAG: hypothetical protein ACJAWV_003730 [Flammeovirgaceae bacterium]|jgi:hypothetical protein